MAFSAALFLLFSLFPRRLAVQFFRPFGSNLPRLCRAKAKMPQQRHRPVLSPQLCHKIRNPVARPVLAAVHFGDKVGEFRQSPLSPGTVFTLNAAL